MSFLPDTDLPPEFGVQAEAYARHRPTYPAALYDWLLGLVPHRRLAWDVGTGSGQVACALAEHFEQVLATDTSAEQLSHATALPNIVYARLSAEQSELPPNSVDLVTAAQAAHWFDLPAFYREVQRVIRPEGILALWGYDAPRFGVEALDGNLHYFDHVFLAPFWSGGREHLYGHYSQLYFPFELLQTPSFEMRRPMRLDDLVGYLDSWSALAAYRRQHLDPLPDMRRRLAEAWPASEPILTARFPFFLRVARLS